MRGRPGTAALAAVATLACAAPLTTLLRSNGWFGATAVAVAALAVVGWALRTVAVPGPLAVAAQGLAAALALTWRLGIGTGPGGLPGLDVLDVCVQLVTEGIHTIQTYAAPAPEKPGLAFLLAGLVALVGLVVDHLCAARRAPAAAGFALLVPFLVACVNTRGALPWGYFAAAALAWLLLLVGESVTALRRSLTRTTVRTRADGQHEDEALDSLTWRARALALVAVVVAVVAQVLLPAPRTHFLTDGLGRDTRGNGSRAGFRSDVDVARDLTSREPTPVLELQADPDIGPLAVATASTYRDGHWVVDTGTAGVALGRATDALPLQEVAGPTAPTRRHTLTVRRAGIEAPQLAVTGWPVRLDGGAAVRTEDGMARVERTLEQYTLTYLAPAPRPADLATPATTRPPVDPETLAVPLPPDSPVRATARRVVDDPRWTTGTRGTPYHSAMALQEYLRSDAFRYSLTLAPGGGEPVAGFLATRQGYCVQFSTAMALMARSVGIPARVRLGFLPGTPDKDGRTVVRRSDAHMWPELYLPGAGWTRFEPTPGGRAGAPPPHARAAAPRPTTPDREPTVRPTAPRRTPTSTAVAPAARAEPSLPRPGVGILVGIGVTLLAGAMASVLPLLARRARRRRLAGATSDLARTEAGWQDLRERLADLGIELPGDAAPSAVRARLALEPSLDPAHRAGLDAWLVRLQAARYAPPGTPLPAEPPKPAELAGAIGRRRSWPVRARAALAPRAGVDALRR